MKAAALLQVFAVTVTGCVSCPRRSRSPRPEPRGVLRNRPKTAALALLMGAGALSGCATYPFGMSRAEWNELTPQQRKEYRRLDASEARRDLIESEQTRRDAAETIKRIEDRLPRMPD